MKVLIKCIDKECGGFVLVDEVLVKEGQITLSGYCEKCKKPTTQAIRITGDS